MSIYDEKPAFNIIYYMLTIISLAVVLIQAAYIVFNSQVLIIFALGIVVLLFDIIFCYDFFYKLLTKKRFLKLPHFLSSVVPLLTSSAPFVLAWLYGNLESPAARFFWFSDSYIGFLASASAFRLLRILLPFNPNYVIKYKWSLILTLTIIFSASILTNAFILPSFEKKALLEHKQCVLDLELCENAIEVQMLAKTSHIAALKHKGLVVKAVDPSIRELQYFYIKSHNFEVWFDISYELKLRAYIRVIAYFAGLLIMIGLAKDLNRHNYSIKHSKNIDFKAESITRDEFIGLLGKK